MDEQTLEACPFCGDAVEYRLDLPVPAVFHFLKAGCPLSGREFKPQRWNTRAAHSVIAGKVAELEEALRHAQGRFLNINICLSSGGTKREAIGIADVGEDCIKMLFASAALAPQIKGTDQP